MHNELYFDLYINCTISNQNIMFQN